MEVRGMYYPQCHSTANILMERFTVLSCQPQVQICLQTQPMLFKTHHIKEIYHLF